VGLHNIHFQKFVGLFSGLVIRMIKQDSYILWSFQFTFILKEHAIKFVKI